MGSVLKIKSEKLNLPPEIAEKLKGKEVELLEVKGGFLLRPVSDAIREARGILKNKQFSTDVYLSHKLEEKKMEK
ncbi:MAG: hypothetical protein STSR0004_19570 [Peptococcaceae bacterium]